MHVFSPYTVTQATLALMTADSACGVPGSAINTSLPLRLFSYGQPTGSVLLSFKTSYAAGLSTGANGSSTWGTDSAGCSLRVASEALAGTSPNDGGGNAVVTWRLSQSQLQHVIYTKLLTVEAKVFVERWGVGYSKWNSDVFGVFNNWDTFFKLTTDVWKGPALLLSTPAASTTGAFAGTLANASVVQSVISPGTWHHVALVANSTTCVLSVDGAEVVSGRCSADRLLWQPTIDLSVGGFVGWVDDVAVSCDARSTQVGGELIEGCCCCCWSLCAVRKQRAAWVCGCCAAYARHTMCRTVACSPVQTFHLWGRLPLLLQPSCMCCCC